MTAQISDSVTYRGERYSLAGVRGEGLFEPAALGLQAVSTSSANWRGFWCNYEVRDGRLELATLHIGLGKRKGEAIFGVTPTTGSLFQESIYEGLHAPIAFTGGMLIGEGFLQEMYVHMGFHPAYKFRVVHELIFEEGRLSSATDQSSIMEKIRESLKGKPLKPGHGASDEELAAWVEGTFTLKYW